MFNVKNSLILEKIMEYSKTLLPEYSSLFAAERFLLAVCDFINGTFSIEDTDYDKKHLEESVKAMDSDVQTIKNTILLYVSHYGDEISTTDALYIQRKVFEAKMKAEKDNYTELLPEYLLDTIINDPTPLINSIIHKIAPSDMSDNKEQKDVPGTEGAKVENTARAKRKFDRLFESETEKNQESGESIPVTEEQEQVQSIGSLTENVKKVRDRLSEVVFGQDSAINVFSLGYFQAEMRLAIDSENKRPAATFLFAGSPGVGKTLLAKTAARLLELPCKNFDMSEYADSVSYSDLIGYGENYKSPKEGLLTGFVRKNPKCVLIFDEIEKAHMTTIHLFLQILDAGRLTDNYTNREVSFNKAIIIFTTNVGKALYNSSETGDFSDTSRKVILKALQNEIHPVTRQPVFPAAICSRFASGNVVMFNNMNANSLCSISKAEAERYVNNFNRKYGVSVSIDNDVYSALLFSEGGTADARTIKSRSEKFFNDELFELFRLVSFDGKSEKLQNIKSINLNIAVPEDKETAKFFVDDMQKKVLIFSANQEIKYNGEADNIEVILTHDRENFEKLLQDGNINFAIIDFDVENIKNKKYLNIEDILSASRDALIYVREKHSDVPVYVLQHKNAALNIEEQKSFLNNGVRGFIELDDNNQLPVKELQSICELLYRQKSMKELAKSNRLITFETGQSISEDGEKAQITLFDFRLSTAVDAEDTNNIMSNVSKPDVTFDDIIGAKDAKDELEFFINYLKDPKQYAESGLRTPKGVLLYGPPGTGKTLLAKATANKAGVTFISAEGNQFIKRYVGEGKDALHDIFAVARKYSPSILFIDEFEAIAKERQGGDHAMANGEDVLTALLTEMDGFNTDISRPVFVLAATNFDVRPGSGRSLDRALLRRFDSLIYVDLPDKSERIKYIEKKIENKPVFEISNEEKENIAVRSTGMSLADLDSVFERALRNAIRTAERKVTDKVLDDAFETILGGEEKKWEISLLERVARHEAGHAFLCWHSGETPSYMTIVARGNHGGYMRHGDNEGKELYTKEELYSQIRIALGGRASEIVYYGDKDGLTTGASGDLVSATEIAQRIICTYGMDDKFGLAVINSQYAESSELSCKIRDAVNRIMDEQMKEAVRILFENRNAIDAIVAELMTKNHLNGPEIKAIFEAHS